MAEDTTTTDTSVHERVHAFLRRYIGDHSLRYDDDIFKLGLVNSLVALEIINFIEKDFGVIVPLEEIEAANFASVSAIARLINRLSTGKSP